MLWSGLGFNFLIVAGVLQYYALINGFWTKANVQSANTTWSDRFIQIYLSDEGSNDTYGNTIVGGLQCALATSIIFAAIGGRAGPLAAALITGIAPILYELNRQILSLFSVNTGGSTTIFEFGGIAGAVLAFCLAKTAHEGIRNHDNYLSHKFNVTLSLIGAAFIWVFFPVLNMNVPSTSFIYTNAGISTFFSISAAVVASIGFGLLVDGKLEFRNIITAPIAGGVIIGCSSTYIYNPLQALMLGSLAGILQVLFNKVEVKLGNFPYWSNGVFFLFGVQGFLGGLFSAVMRAINKTSSTYGTAYDSLPSKYVYDQRGQISATFITLGIAIVTGLILFVVLKCFNAEEREDFYHDKTYWIVEDDGISNRKIEKISARPSETDQSESIEVSEGGEIKGTHAYL